MAAADRLVEIPGVSRKLAMAVIAETGLDVTRLPTADHLVSWARVALGTQIRMAAADGSQRWGNNTPCLSRTRRADLCAPGTAAARPPPTPLPPCLPSPAPGFPAPAWTQAALGSLDSGPLAAPFFSLLLSDAMQVASGRLGWSIRANWADSAVARWLRVNALAALPVVGLAVAAQDRPAPGSHRPV